MNPLFSPTRAGYRVVTRRNGVISSHQNKKTAECWAEVNVYMGKTTVPSEKKNTHTHFEQQTIIIRSCNI